MANKIPWISWDIFSLLRLKLLRLLCVLLPVISVLISIANLFSHYKLSFFRQIAINTEGHTEVTETQKPIRAT